MCDSQVASRTAAGNFPANDGALVGRFMPIRNPGVGQHTRRVVFEHLAIAVKLADSVDIHFAFLGVVAPAAAAARLNGEALDRAFLAGPPLHDLLRVDERLKNALRRSRNVNFTDYGIQVGGDCGSCHFRFLDSDSYLVRCMSNSSWWSLPSGSWNSQSSVWW